MLHFYSKLAISRNITKFISQILDLRNWRYDFCENARNLDLNKREEVTVESLTAVLTLLNATTGYRRRRQKCPGRVTLFTIG